MHAFLLITKDDEKREMKAHDIANMYGAVLTPITLQKMADVKELQKLTKLTLSPTAFYIQDIDTATIDSANAFLKQLEEPNDKIYYILTAHGEDKVLPTIVSRCQVIRVKGESKIYSLAKQQFFTKGIGEQLRVVDAIKKREDAITFVENILEETHEELIASPSIQTSMHLEELTKTLTALLKNGNVTSQLTRFVVVVNRQ